jgi:hypothetical protein
LDDLVGQYIDASISPATKCTYAAGQRRYLKFCMSTGVLPLPLTEGHLSRYVAHLAEEGLKHTSIKGYLSALIRRMQGVGDPFQASWPRLETTLKGAGKDRLHEAEEETPNQTPDSETECGGKRGRNKTISCYEQRVVCAFLGS